MNIITGLDVGSSYIKGIVAEVKKNGTPSVITVFKYPSAGFRKGALVDAEAATAVLTDIGRDIEKISRYAVRNVFVNINSEHIKSHPSRGIVAVSRSDFEIQQDDIDRVTQASQAMKMLPNRLMLHNITREYFVDDVGDITDPVGMTGSRLEVSTLVVEGFSPQVSILTKQLERAGMLACGIIFNPLAAARAVLSKRQKELGVILIDFGSDTTSFAVYQENKIVQTKSLPIGSGYVTKDIAIGLQTSIDIAEQLKVECGYAASRDIPRHDLVKLAHLDPENKERVTKKFLSEIIEGRLAEILDVVSNEIKSLGRTVQLPGGAVITGGGVKLSGMTELVRSSLKLATQIGVPDVSSFEVVNPTHQSLLADPEFSTAVGLVMWGMTGERKPTHDTSALIRNIFKNLMP
ncbi:MAG: cell division protein FtsA [Candidatus Jorgensenbacteria bacterium]|nr:cell division protein FtsA [Candidatus Jorgensenbacteria bacterium]